MSDENKPPEDFMKNFAIMMPTGPTKYKKSKKYFGWYVLWVGEWVGIKRYKRIVPVRSDLIQDFLFWKFAKPIEPQYGFRSWTINGFDNIQYFGNRTKKYTDGNKEKPADKP